MDSKNRAKRSFPDARPGSSAMTVAETVVVTAAEIVAETSVLVREGPATIMPAEAVHPEAARLAPAEHLKKGEQTDVNA